MGRGAGAIGLCDEWNHNKCTEVAQDVRLENQRWPGSCLFVAARLSEIREPNLAALWEAHVIPFFVTDQTPIVGQARFRQSHVFFSYLGGRRVNSTYCTNGGWSRRLEDAHHLRTVIGPRSVVPAPICESNDIFQAGRCRLSISERTQRGKNTGKRHPKGDRRSCPLLACFLARLQAGGGLRVNEPFCCGLCNSSNRCQSLKSVQDAVIADPLWTLLADQVFGFSKSAKCEGGKALRISFQVCTHHQNR